MMVAACPEPIPGRNEQNGVMIQARNLVVKGMYSFNGCIVCGGRAGFVLSEVMSPARPKSPDKRGTSGSLIGREKVSEPRSPAKVAMMRASCQSVSRNMISRRMNRRR